MNNANEIKGAKAKVLAKYPDMTAHLFEHGWWLCRTGNDRFFGPYDTEEEAWIKPASRLPARVEPAICTCAKTIEQVCPIHGVEPAKPITEWISAPFSRTPSTEHPEDAYHRGFDAGVVAEDGDVALYRAPVASSIQNAIGSCGCKREFHDAGCPCTCGDFDSNPLCVMHRTEPTPTPERGEDKLPDDISLAPERWRWLYKDPKGSPVLDLHFKSALCELGRAELERDAALKESSELKRILDEKETFINAQEDELNEKEAALALNTQWVEELQARIAQRDEEIARTRGLALKEAVAACIREDYVEESSEHIAVMECVEAIRALIDSTPELARLKEVPNA